MSETRIACVDVPALPLQLVRRDHPEWRGRSVVVIDKDSPRGVVLWANEQARKNGILPGVRYAAGLSLDADLRAVAYDAALVQTALAETTILLRTFSPSVEPSPIDEEPGIFWIDATGLSLLYPTLDALATAVRKALFDGKLTAAVSIGFSRFGCYATVRALAGRGQRVWSSADDEQRAAARVPLERIGLDPGARELLAQLGVQVVGQLAQLPEAGLVRRFGKDVQRLRQRAAGTREEPLTPVAAEERLSLRLDLDEPIADRESLLFLGKQLLDPLLQRLATHGQALAEMTLTLDVEPGFSQRKVSDAPTNTTITSELHALRPAVPTLDAPQLLGLLRLRLELIAIPGGVRAIAVAVTGVKATRDQLLLFFDVQKPKRDLQGGARALARVRAALGDEAVVRAVPRNGHLPEATFAWEPIDELVQAKPRRVLERPLIRRVQTKPTPLPARPAREPDGWLLKGMQHGAVQRLVGPFKISGGWWRSELSRDYYFAELVRGELCWIYYDAKRRRWFQHGEAA